MHHAVAHALELALACDEALQVALLPTKLQVNRHARLDLLDVEWLGDVVDTASREGAYLVDGFAVGADEDDGDGGQHRILLQFRAHLVAIHHGHIDVEQDEIRGIGVGGLESQAPAGNRPRAVAAAFEHVGQHLEIGWGVVDDQDAGTDEVGGNAFSHETTSSQAYR